MSRTFLPLLVIAATLLLSIHTAIARDPRVAEGIRAAEEFLLLVDTGQYARSWESASSFFRSQVPKEAWVRQINALRPSFGTIVSRQILDAQHAEQLPGAPDGSYIVIQYDTVFEHKMKAVETLTPMLDKDGKWRISGYYIK